MKALDLFCGLQGWGEGLVAEGFDYVGVEINPKIAALCKHPVIVSDVCDLNPADFKGYDLIVGSPPCRDFSKISWALRNRWKRPPDPEGEGIRLIKAFLNFVEAANPTYWCMENSPYLERYYSSPRVIANFSPYMRRALWGNFPAFLIPTDLTRGTISGGTNRVTGAPRRPTHKSVYPNRLRAWERAIIPFPVAQALGKAVKEALNDVERDS